MYWCQRSLLLWKSISMQTNADTQWSCQVNINRKFNIHCSRKTLSNTKTHVLMVFCSSYKWREDSFHSLPKCVQVMCEDEHCAATSKRPTAPLIQSVAALILTLNMSHTHLKLHTSKKLQPTTDVHIQYVLLIMHVDKLLECASNW